MSMRYPGGFIASTPVTAAYPSGVWTQAQAIPYQAQNVWTRDQYWPYTTLLLQGNGTNGAQNNTFLDSSSNNFTITRNGNTTQGSFTPYEQDGYWSNFFDGSTNSFISAPNNTALDLSGVAFTIEGWIFPTRTFNGAQSGFRNIISKRTPSGSATNYNIQLWFNSNKIGFWNGSSVALSSAEVPLNAWTHFAYTYNGSNTLTLWLNGAVDTVFTYTVGANTSDPVRIGSHIDDTGTYNNFGGYISNIRVVKGSQVYSGSTFVPPAAPLTAITNTSLLTCQSNRFRDNSTNAFAITVNGSPSVQAFQPFPGATTYSGTVLGGSGYFDGSGDYLTVPQNAAFAFGTGDFTVEFWVNVSTYRTSPGGFYDCFLALGNFADSPYFRITPSGTAEVGLVANSLSGTTVFQRNTWYHYAVTRSGTTARLFINGVLESTVTNSSNLANGTAVYIGTSQWNVANETMTGLLSNLRIVKGTAIYTANFTPPTTPVTAVANTSFLANFTNAGIYDNSMMNNLETVGNAQVSTSVVKYGTGSMAFDGSGDWLVSPDSQNYNFGSGDFTFEFWINFNSVSGTIGVLGKRTSEANFAPFLIEVSSSALKLYMSTSGSSWAVNALSTSTLVTNTWYHIAFVRSGSTVYLFVNGVSVGSTGTVSGSLMTNTSPLYIGANSGSPSGAAALNGYIDDLRITKAARYITNFTPPPARMPGQ